MIFRTIAIIALLGFSMTAAAQFTTVARAYEVPLTEFRAPATPSGATSFRQCSDCERYYVRVTPDTRYTINRKPVRFEKFREALQAVRDRENTTLVVKHHLETDTIVAINLPVQGLVEDD